MEKLLNGEEIVSDVIDFDFPDTHVCEIDMDFLNNLINWIRVRQDKIYGDNSKNISNNDLQKIENFLIRSFRFIFPQHIEIIFYENQIAYLNNMSKQELIKWLNFYQLPGFIKEFSEKANKSLGYMGN